MCKVPLGSSNTKWRSEPWSSKDLVDMRGNPPIIVWFKNEKEKVHRVQLGKVQPVVVRGGF